MSQHNAVIAPSLGRNSRAAPPIFPCHSRAGRDVWRATEPSRPAHGKILRFGRTKTSLNLDIYNSSTPKRADADNALQAAEAHVHSVGPVAKVGMQIDF